LINQTSNQFDTVIHSCREIFIKKNKDYGQSWRIMRISSIADQIYIKAARIRNIEEKGLSMVDEGIESEFRGIINYCIMALIQVENNEDAQKEISFESLIDLFDKIVADTKKLMLEKNHDYGEIWRSMLVSTFTDMLLMRINRIHQIIENKGQTISSEGIDSNFMDMINYSIFALIQLEEKNTAS
jgi:hypothetical protein